MAPLKSEGLQDSRLQHPWMLMHVGRAALAKGKWCQHEGKSLTAGLFITATRLRIWCKASLLDLLLLVEHRASTEDLQSYR
jgi:hypothetical protein